MLERASTCLETGGRQLLRPPKRCVRSRRMLHSSFWHHGASDLSLPIWWSSDLISNHPDFDSDDKSRGQRGHNGLLLDFLYPEKTLALIRRMSICKWNVLQTQRRLCLHGTSVRQFSTRRDGQELDEEIYLEKLALQEEVDQRLEGSTARDALRDILDTSELGKQELAWRLYSTIQERSRTPDLRADLLEYLACPVASFDANRMLRVFNTLPHEHRRASSYRIAISAYIALRMVGPAVQLHEEAATGKVGLQFGTHIVLGQTVQDNQWDLTLRVFKAFWRRVSRENDFKSIWTKPKGVLWGAIWASIAEIPDLKNNLLSLLQYVRQFQHEIQSNDENKEALRLFMAGFVPEVTLQTLNVDDPDEDVIWHFFTNLFRDIRTLGLQTAHFYNSAIGQMLNLLRYQEYFQRSKPFLELYRQYREDALHNPDPNFRPPMRLLMRLMHQVGDKGSLNGIAGLVSDWHLFHPNSPLPYDALVYLLEFYAGFGDAESVHEYFSQIRERYSHKIDLRVLSSLLFVYARRIDVRSTGKQFERISGEFGLAPDTTCWNILLLAYARADDLDGALHCFSRILESGIQPDKHTFGPLLNLCASRGDVEAFEEIFSKAQQLKVHLRNEAVARAGYVQACLNSDDVEGAEAIAQGMLADHRAGTLHGPLTPAWNLIIQHYALQKDVASSRRVYKQMVENGIPLDTWTYAGLMRSLVELRQTNAAYKILRVTMPRNQVRGHAFHYALVMTGFIRERQFHRAMEARKRMLRRNVLPTVSSHLASLETIGINELRKLQDAGDENPLTRLVEVEESLREMLLESYESSLALRQPRRARLLGMAQDSVPEGYFGFLILLYSARGAYAICKELFEAASIGKSDEAGYEAPIGLLTAIMEAHLAAKEYDEVAKCWELARLQADKMTKTWHQATTDPDPPKIEFGSLVDPSVIAQAAEARIASNRRQILFKTSRIYIRSLLAQESPQSLQQAMRTISNLLTNGYIIDNLTWNEFIQMLARRGRVMDAFTACEAYLMPNFPGWRQQHPAYVRREQTGYSYMEVRHDDLSRKTLMPRYRTLVFLAAAYGQIKREEANGMGYNPEYGGWAREVLEKIAPLTVRAIETMPRTRDRLQQMYVLGM
ncbi:uncharacterized protein BDR25DRAFT_267511 [Lindgomyces ingoldianus]|uniref:Uncharacterized protein n=1 Tax=Lindgomyces ingoldianus TaxID=673940 RepID=A0ACB6QMH7_9PLEO|nr:uncharacterized protein BDR25DRAFT_267511 [Lindgomyces ingoldianus]KAF2467346.1 hypothetical protein BDR25DRAFT_267511 [Lindgomyces ingoldianus]